MKKDTKKRLLTLGVMLATAFTFAGCTIKEKPTPGDDPNKDNPPIETPVEPPVDPIDPEPVRVPIEKWEAFINSFGQNFTYQYVNKDRTSKVYVDGDKCFADLIDDKPRYCFLEGEIYCQIYFGEDGMWHKDYRFLEDENILLAAEWMSFIKIHIFNHLSWESYDEKTQTFIGRHTTMVGGDRPPEVTDNVKMNLFEDGVRIDFPSGEVYEITNVGKTEISLPENVIDETQPKQELIYTVDEKGNYKFNIPLLYDIMDDWFKGNNQWDMDACASLLRGGSPNAVYKSIVYINANKEKFEVCVEHENLGKILIRNFAIENNDLFEAFKNENLNKAKDFTDFINEISWRSFKISEGITIDDTVSKENFDIMTKNIFNRLEKIGYQKGEIIDPGVKVEGMKPENALFGFATPQGYEGAAGQMGYTREWNHYYLIEKDGECKWINVDIVCASSSGGSYYHILNDSAVNRWFIFSYEEKEVNKENLDYYKSILDGEKDYIYAGEQKEKGNSSENANREIAYIPQGKRQEISTPIRNY